MTKNSNLKHLAIIMDGNRRWAQAHNLPKLEGHRKGYDKVEQVVEWCMDANIEILTVYAFSTENWNRAEEEVGYLMNLLQKAVEKDLYRLAEKGVRIKIIGQKERLSESIQQAIVRIEEKTADHKNFLLQIALSYGGRAEIVQAVQSLRRENIDSTQITEELFAEHLWTANTPDPDLIVRTSGEQRLSNFLTWQSAYSELLFLDKHWPDFEQSDITAIVEEFSRRQRRFGT